MVVNRQEEHDMSLFGPKVAARVAERLVALNYIQPNGKPDVRRFCLEHGYDKTIVYYWLSNRSTPVKELPRLAADLQTTPAYLLFGTDAPKETRRRRRASTAPPLRGAAAEPATLISPLMAKGAPDTEYYVNLKRWLRAWISHRWGRLRADLPRLYPPVYDG